MAEATRLCRRCGVDISELRSNAIWCSTCPKRVRKCLDVKACAECGTDFQPKRKDALCCSRTCNMRRLNRKYTATVNQRPSTATCPACAAEFVPRRSDQLYCSAACGARKRYRPTLLPDRDCAYCGKTFTPPKRISTVCSRVCSRRVTYDRYRDQRIAAAVAWGRANKDARSAIANQHKAQRRALLQQAEVCVGISSRDWIKLVRRYRHCCAYCGAAGAIHMEHVIPVSRGGRHAIGNVLPACEKCNLSKQTCLVAEWKLRKIRLAKLRAAQGRSMSTEVRPSPGA